MDVEAIQKFCDHMSRETKGRQGPIDGTKNSALNAKKYNVYMMREVGWVMARGWGWDIVV